MHLCSMASMPWGTWQVPAAVSRFFGQTLGPLLGSRQAPAQSAAPASQPPRPQPTPTHFSGVRIGHGDHCPSDCFFCLKDVELVGSIMGEGSLGKASNWQVHSNWQGSTIQAGNYSNNNMSLQPSTYVLKWQSEG